MERAVETHRARAIEVRELDVERGRAASERPCGDERLQPVLAGDAGHGHAVASLHERHAHELLAVGVEAKRVGGALHAQLDVHASRVAALVGVELEPHELEAGDDVAAQPHVGRLVRAGRRRERRQRQARDEHGEDAVGGGAGVRGSGAAGFAVEKGGHETSGSVAIVNRRSLPARRSARKRRAGQRAVLGHRRGSRARNAPAVEAAGSGG